MSVPVPLTVVGGYLGAGKTTLINGMLRGANGRRLAILVNEFGALPIDEDLIIARSENLISIAGGCICCTFGDSLADALAGFARMDAPPIMFSSKHPASPYRPPLPRRHHWSAAWNCTERLFWPMRRQYARGRGTGSWEIRSSGSWLTRTSWF